jgi:hypothetical protein
MCGVLFASKDGTFYRWKRRNAAALTRHSTSNHRVTKQAVPGMAASSEHVVFFFCENKRQQFSYNT